MNLKINNRVIAWIAFSILLAVYVNTVIENSINIPYSDDFHQQLSTASGLEKGHSKTYSLFRQHNMHRLFTTHVFTYLEHTIFGSVNLNHQLYIALAMLLALALVLISFANVEHRSIFTVMVGALLLSPEAGATWVGGTTQYYSLVLFGLLSIKTLSLIEQPRFLLISLICLWLSAYSMIAGVTLPVIGIAYLFLSEKIKTLPGKVWAICSILILVLYFNGFQSQGNSHSVLHFVENPEFAFDFTSRLLGNFLSDIVEVGLLSNLALVLLFGFIVLVFTKRSFKKFYLSHEGLAFVFILSIVGCVVAGRVGFNDLNIAYADRYFIYTKTLWLLVFVFLLNDNLVPRDLKSFSLGLVTLYVLATYQFEVKNLEAHTQNQNIAMLDHLVRDNPEGFEFGGKPQKAGKLVNEAIALGVYSPELRVTKSRPLKYLKYTDFKQGLNASLVRDEQLGEYRYLAFTVDADTSIHEVAIVPREVSGPATLLKPAAKIASYRRRGADLVTNAVIYEVIIDTSMYDESLTNDVFVISLGMITSIATL